MDETQVYVGTYAKYNDGSIAGKWLTLSDYADRGEFIEACKKLHSDEADPELMFQDRQGAASRAISECEVPEVFWEFLELEESDKEIVEAWMEAMSADLQEAMETGLENFYGSYDNETDFGEQLLEGTDRVPPHLEGYIDFERYGNDHLTGFSHGYYKNRLWVWF